MSSSNTNWGVVAVDISLIVMSAMLTIKFMDASFLWLMVLFGFTGSYNAKEK